MYLVGVDFVSDLAPLMFAHLSLALEPPFEIQDRKMNIQAAFREPLAKGRNDLSLSAAFSGDELGQSAHIFGQTARFRGNNQNGRRLFFRQPVESSDGEFEIVDFSSKNVRRAGDGIFVGVEIGVDRMILTDPLVQKIDVIGGRQMSPLGQVFPPCPPCGRLHPFNVPKKLILGGIAQPSKSVLAGIGPGGGCQSVNIEGRARNILKSIGDLGRR